VGRGGPPPPPLGGEGQQQPTAGKGDAQPLLLAYAPLLLTTHLCFWLPFAFALSKARAYRQLPAVQRTAKAKDAEGKRQRNLCLPLLVDYSTFACD
jgi:hypothetical protein